MLGFILFAVWAVLGSERGRAQASAPQVVILNSYHPGEVWTDNELAGLLPALRRVYPELTPTIEYLDTKRFPGSGYLALLKEHLIQKYRDRRVDLLLVLDNPALDLVMKYRDELFPAVPIVFAGINGFRPELLQGRDRITGVSETQDMEGTLKLALSLHPATRQVLIVHDYTASGLAVRREMEAILPRYRDRWHIAFSPDAPFAELERQLRALPADAVVLLPTYVTDRDGQVLSREESTRRIAAASPAPVYAMHATRLGHGIVGGLLLEGKEHGALAAALALRVLAGEDPARIPVESSRSHPMFDEIELRRFRIDPAALPAQSEVINRPASFYAQHRRLVLTILSVLSFFTLAVVALGLALRRTRRAEAALRESEKRYRALFEHSRDAVLVADASTGHITQANWAAEALFVRPRAELIGLHQTALHPPGEEDKYAAGFAEHASSGEASCVSGEIQTGDGRRVSVEISASSIKMPDGTLALQGFFRDITERKRAEQALHDRGILYRAAIETSLDGFWMTDAEGRLLEVNDAYVRKSGYSRQELLAMRVVDLEARETPDEIRDHVKAAIRAGGDLFESLHRAKSGVIWPAEINISYWPIDGGRLFSFIRDIAQRKRSETLLQIRLRLSDLVSTGGLDELLQAALDAAELLTSSRIGFFHFVDPDQEHLTLQAWSTNTIRHMCAAEGKGLHYPISAAGVWVECIGRREPVIHNDYAGLLHKKGLPEGHAPVIRELTVPILRDDVIVAIIGVGNKPVDYTTADVEAVRDLASIAMDVIERKRAEQALRASLEEKTALLKEVHHRVKNNLQIVTSLLSLQASQVQSPAALAALQDTQSRVRSMALLHESLYRQGDLAQVEGDAYLTHLCAHLSGSFGLVAGRVRLHHDLAPVALGLDQAVPCGLIVNELVSNAFKHAFPGERGGEIRVELRAEPDGRLALVVADDGVGLPPGLDWRRGDTLGLQLVAGLARQLGAHVETETAAGTRFRLVFPAHRPGEPPPS